MFQRRVATVADRWTVEEFLAVGRQLTWQLLTLRGGDQVQRGFWRGRDNEDTYKMKREKNKWR